MHRLATTSSSSFQIHTRRYYIHNSNSNSFLKVSQCILSILDAEIGELDKRYKGNVKIIEESKEPFVVDRGFAQ
jgi:hypothetical protein